MAKKRTTKSAGTSAFLSTDSKGGKVIRDGSESIGPRSARNPLSSATASDRSPKMTAQSALSTKSKRTDAPAALVETVLNLESAFTSFEDVHRLLEASLEDVRNKATSLRLNKSLRAAADLAVKHGWAQSFTALVEQSVTEHLAGFVSAAAEQAALDEHYSEHPEAKSELWEIAVAAAEIDGNPLAEHPDVIRRAADALGENAGVDAVLIWAAGALAGADS